MMNTQKIEANGNVHYQEKICAEDFYNNILTPKPEIKRGRKSVAGKNPALNRLGKEKGEK